MIFFEGNLAKCWYGVTDDEGTVTLARLGPVTLAGFSISRLDVQLDLVWVVDYSGACVPNTVPPGNKGGDCLGDRWEVAIDANEGTWLASYSGSVLE